MESVRINYGEIHQEVTRFVNELAGRYVSGTSSAMQNVKAIPDILDPNDPAFRQNDADKVIKSCTFFLQVMDVLLDTVPSVVKPEYADWLDGQTRKLKMWKTLVNMSLVSLSFNSNVGNVDAASGGIGGVNFGVDTDMDINVRIKIQQLLHALKDISQTTQSR